jgi:tetraacyldisaccharide 4'-kinase
MAIVTLSVVWRCGYEVTGFAWNDDFSSAPDAILTSRSSGPAHRHLNRLKKRKAIFLLYRVLEAIASPLIPFWLLLREFRHPGYFRTIGQRLGSLPALWQKTAPGAIWLHAVSVGEILAAAPLIDELIRRNPATPIFVSTTTLAGRETAEKRLKGVVDGIFYAPLDLVWCVRRVLRRIRPSLVVIMETEIWPNLFNEAKRINCGLAIVNGRISDRALPRYRKFAPLFSAILPLADRILTQSDEMSRRFIAAGAPPSIVETAGNLKYDFRPHEIPAESPIRAFLEAEPTAPLWIAASTSDDGVLEEEAAVLAAQRALPGWRLILAPRQPARFEAVARTLEASGLDFTRRSNLTHAAASILLLDSIGELSALFAHATAVFMGGTLANKGGHNILEPAIFGKPVVAGPHLENFRDIEEHFEARRAVLRIAAGDELASAITAAAGDPGLGRRAREAALAEAGATARTADALLALSNTRYPSDRPPQPKFFFLWVFSLLWRYFAARDRRSKRARTRRLPVPVVSVGNITAGGTGKTPVTIELLRDFRDLHPALLTRGHGRSTNQIVLIPHGGQRLPAGLTGDEAQLFTVAVACPMAIGGDRYTAATRLLDHIRPGAFFLDDGFQHEQLARDFDLVLIDSLNPFGGCEQLPLGRLREPLEGLARADAFLITRDLDAMNLPAIEATLRRYNPHAPIYRSRITARRWVSPDGEIVQPAALSNKPAVAFCGLGNPQSFWKSLAQVSADVLERYDFGDHHRYRPAEIRRLVQRARDLRAEFLLTTAKDAVNLCDGFHSLIEPLQLLWLEIHVEIDNREDLLRRISEKIARKR